METRYANIHADLIDGCRRGDRSAQHAIYTQYAHAMYNSAFRILKNHDDASDILQESFIDMYTKIDSFRGDSSFGAWFKRIVVNKSLNFIKKSKPEFLEMEVIENTPEDEPEESNSFEYEIKDVKSAVSQLPEGYRLVFNLYMFEGYSHRDIAEELGISEATSKSQLSRAKVKLRTYLSKEL